MDLSPGSLTLPRTLLAGTIRRSDSAVIYSRRNLWGCLNIEK
jgi:hypothetical protein